MTEQKAYEPILVDVALRIEQSEDESAQRKAVARKLCIPPSRIRELRLRKHSIDARKPQIKANLRFEVGLDAELPAEPEPTVSLPSIHDTAKTVLIVGSGPAGLFAALTAIERGWKPIVLERGKDASARRFDLAPLLREGRVVEDSNYCFGEGGAGTFSDGKLYTRATKRGPVRKVYETFVAHGAPPRILIDAHPHIGSNLLPNVVKAIRQSIIDAGGEVRFEAKVTDFLIEKGKMQGLVINDAEEITGRAVILATGHSARDIYRLLDRHEISLEQKPFAVGVRIEHPQPLIDSLQYHYERGKERPLFLPAARYSLATKIRNRGVHSFCMCPGGFIVPAATENDEVVVNGMSLSKRDSPFANSGMVVTIEPEDIVDLTNQHGVLGGIVFQKQLEQLAKRAGGGGQVAPAQRLIDFLKKRDSKTLAKTSYKPGLAESRIDELLPDFISDRMAEGLSLFGNKMRGYISDECNLIGFETRTSSPVRIPRDPGSLRHPQLPGLFPCGEGAGFAGGIVSAALDGMRCADAL
jgi:uncharacterized FAD-dependent dehydrogenase